jgi:hypothetical protein
MQPEMRIKTTTMTTTKSTTRETMTIIPALEWRRGVCAMWTSVFGDQAADDGENLMFLSRHASLIYTGGGGFCPFPHNANTKGKSEGDF